MHPFLLHNADILPSGDAHRLTPGQVGLLNGWGVFSTLRVLDGVLFAWERHLARMQGDAERMRVPFPPDSEALRQSLLQLVDANQAHNATLRVAVIRNRGGLFETPGDKPAFDTIAFTVPLRDWGTSHRLGVASQARHAASEFAGAKITSWAVNLTLYERAREQGYDEVVLLNERQEVAELTSANIFAIFGDRVLTPPLSAGCLAGITRAILLEELTVPGLTFHQASLTLSELAAADEVFVTSSTREVVPVTAIAGLDLQAGVRQSRSIHQHLREFMHDYVRQRTSRSSGIVLNTVPQS